MTDSTPATDKDAKTVNKSPRRRAREFALQGIYQWLLSANPVTVIEQHAQSVAGFEKADRELYLSVLRGVLDNINTLENHFAGFLDRSVHELSPVERAILLLASHEMGAHPETPYRVIINEAIELAKEYGGTDGHRFVNGVLDRVASQLRPEEFAASRRKPRQG